MQVHFQDRTSTSKIEVEYPLGHRRRRNECFPALEKKLMASLSTRMPPTRAGRVFERIVDPQTFDRMAVPDYVELFSPAPAPFILPPIRGGADAWDERAARGMSAAALLADDGAEDDDPPAMLEAPGGEFEGEDDPPRIDYPRR